MKSKHQSSRLLLTTAALLAGLVGLVAAGCARETIPEPDATKVGAETTAVSVFYPTGKLLVEERHVVPTQENMPLVALRELFKAQPQEFKIVVTLPEAKVRSVVVDRATGIATVDFTRDILDFPSEDRKAKLVAFAAISETLAQFDEIKGFRILVEGKSRGTIGGRRIEDFWGAVGLSEKPFPINRETVKESTKSAN